MFIFFFTTYIQVGVNAGHCRIYYSLCISLTDHTNDMMDVRTCDGDYGVVGFRLDSADRDQGNKIIIIIITLLLLMMMTMMMIIIIIIIIIIVIIIIIKVIIIIMIIMT